MARCVSATLIVVVLLLASGASRRAAAADGELLPAVDDDWSYWQSPNFELYSREGDGTSRGLLHDLELLRAVFVDRFRCVERARLDVTVYQFRTRKDFQAYATKAGEKHTSRAGFYLPLPDRAVSVLAPAEDREGARRLVFHEYIHHLFNAAEQDPPVWFNEGMAEFLAGIRVEGDQLQIGHPVANRLLSLRDEKLLSLDTIFGANRQSQIYRSDDHTGLFYAESWALVHYWYCGKSDLPPGAVTRFITGIMQPTKPTPVELRQLFVDCFGMEYDAMVKRLDQYVRTGRYTYSTQALPDLPPASGYASRRVGRDEIRLRLAELAMRVNRSPAGDAVLARATFGELRDPRPYELLGAVAELDGDTPRAIEQWEKAVAAGTTNVAVLRELALIEGRGWFREFDFHLHIPAADADRMRTRLRRSIEHEPQQSAAYEMLAWVEAFAENRVIANINLVQSNFKALPKKARTLVALAMVRVRLGQTAEALNLLQSLDKLDPDPWTAQAAEVITATLEDRPVQNLGDTTGATEVHSDLTPPLKEQRRLPTVPLPDDL